MKIHTWDGNPPGPQLLSYAQDLLQGKDFPEAELIRQRKSRIYRVVLEQGVPVYFKHYCGTRPKEWVKRCVRSPVRNIKLWRKLRHQEIPSPKPLLVVQSLTQSVLVTSEAQEMTLQDRIQERGLPDREIMGNMGRSWGRMHREGLMHYDPDPRNILIPEENSATFGVLDLDSLYLVPWFPAWLRRKHLTRVLWRLSRKCIRICHAAPGPEEFMAFWDQYQAAAGALPIKHGLILCSKLERRSKEASHSQTLADAARNWRRELEQTISAG